MLSFWHFLDCGCVEYLYLFIYEKFGACCTYFLFCIEEMGCRWLSVCVCVYLEGVVYGDAVFSFSYFMSCGCTEYCLYVLNIFPFLWFQCWGWRVVGGFRFFTFFACAFKGQSLSECCVKFLGFFELRIYWLFVRFVFPLLCCEWRTGKCWSVCKCVLYRFPIG